MKKLILFVMAGLIFFGMGFAAPGPGPKDFNGLIILGTERNGAIYEMALPQTVYRGVLRSDLADIRIYNSQGDAVPHTVLSVDVNAVESSSRETVHRLAFFPVSAPNQSQGNFSMQVQTNESGTIIELKSSGAKSDEKINAYLIDLSLFDHIPDKLRFDWSGGDGSFMLETRVRGSNDLCSWSTVLASASLADFVYNGHNLRKDMIYLPSAKYKYLRLEWDDPVQLQGITGFFTTAVRKSQERQREWSDARVVDVQSGAVVVDGGGYMPTDFLRFNFPHRNTVLNANIMGSYKQDGPWHRIADGVYYALDIDGHLVARDEIRIVASRYRFFKIVPHGDSLPWGVGDVAVKLGGVPDKLIFVAQGASPFRLSYGNAGVISNNSNMDALLQELGYPNRVVAKKAWCESVADTGDVSGLTKAVDRINWKILFMWGFLVAGVTLAGGMALSLYREIDRNDGE